MSGMPKMGEFCWQELATNNVQAAKEFYGNVFGWKFSDHDMGDMSYTMVKIGDNKEFAGIWAIQKDKQKEIPPHWMAYILVDDLDKSLDKARNQGASIIKEATNAGDFGRLAVISDPTGAYVALWQSLKNK